MSSEYCAIVVKILEPKNRCFVAMPFKDPFEGIYTAIEKAANNIGLQPFRTKDIQEGVDFVKDIIAELQSARMVVAVCSPEPETGTPNPNVMYEAGLAHALGKPTILIMSDFGKLPKDIDHHYAVGYKPDEADPANVSNSLIQRIQLMMIQRFNKSQNGLTDEAWAERVSLAQNRHRMFLEPDFWDRFRDLLTFAKTIHDEIQQIDTGHIDRLLQEIKDIVFSESDQLRKIRSFGDRCRDYNEYYEFRTKQHVFDSLPEMTTRVGGEFQYLLANSDDSLKPRINKAYGFYEQIKGLLNESLELHNDIRVALRGDLLTSLRDQKTAAAIHGMINDLSTKAKFTIIQADTLIVSLIDVIT